ncbi:hypothetical protein AnigIFM63326_009892 [Aspergillus niger]|nr:hypothetical protein AnigIFM63326_009892 [Aspergillus niger]
MACLTDLPNELLLDIVSYIEYNLDLAALSQTNRRIYHLTSSLVDQKINHMFKNSRLYVNESRAMQRAAANGNVDCVRRLFRAGIPARPDIHYDRWKPSDPATVAAMYGHANVVRLFLDAGVDPNVITSHQSLCARGNLLTIAIQQGHESVVRLLLEHGVKLVFTKEDGDINQPLSVATEFGHYELVKLLLEHGCNPLTPDYRQDGKDETSAFFRAGARSLPILQLFLEPNIPKVYFSDPKYNSQELVLKVLEWGDIPLARFLLDHGAELAIPNYDSSEPTRVVPLDDVLYRVGCASGQYSEKADFLLQKFNVDNIIKDGNFSAVVCLAAGAALGGNVGLLDRVLEVDWVHTRKVIQPQDWKDRLTLYLVDAVRWGHLEVARLLLDHGADPNGPAPDGEDSTFTRPVYTAVEKGHTKLVALLLDRGADPNPEDRGGLFLFATSCCLHQVVRQTRLDIVQLLIDRKIHVPEVSSGLDPMTSLVCSGAKVFQLAVQHMNLKLKVGDIWHMQAFQIAVKTGDIPIITEFLEAGFKPNNWSWLLPNAADHFDPDVAEQAVDLLLKYGADIDVQSHETSRPNLYSFNSSCLAVRKDRVIKLLLKKGANPFRVDWSGKHVFIAAAAAGEIHSVKGVLEYIEETGIPFGEVRSMVEEAARCATSAAEFAVPLAQKGLLSTSRAFEGPFEKARNITRVEEYLWRWYWRRVYPC